MNDIAIDVSHVTKRFVLSGGGWLKTTVVDCIRGRKPRTFTALDDINFQVLKGETVGLIGHNGAGKSTLLSIIAGTMSTTTGSVRTVGSLSSLLELGAGFHPDLTGRENVLLYGAIMGIPRETMRRRFDAIVDFAGLREFIDQPVRFYSSGMYVRLGFSVAVEVDPDILLVDEVLAVGDADFQAKCLAKMDDFRRAGKSMILISHDIGTIRRVSDRIAYLSHGRLIGLGDPERMAKRYEADRIRASLDHGSTTDSSNDPATKQKEWGTREAELTNVVFVDPTNGVELPDETFLSAEGDVVLRIRWHSNVRIEDPVFGYSIAESTTGRCIYGTNTQIERQKIEFIEGDGSIQLRFHTDTIQAGVYLLSFSLHSADHMTNYHRLENHLLLRVTRKKPFDGLCFIPSEWTF